MVLCYLKRRILTNDKKLRSTQNPRHKATHIHQHGFLFQHITEPMTNVAMQKMCKDCKELYLLYQVIFLKAYHSSNKALFSSLIFACFILFKGWWALSGASTPCLRQPWTAPSYSCLTCCWPCPLASLAFWWWCSTHFRGFLLAILSHHHYGVGYW